MNATLLVIGGGGHAAVVIDAARSAGWSVAGVLDDDPEVEVTLDPLGVVRLGGLHDGPNVLDTLPDETAVIAATGDASHREAWLSSFDGARIATIIHPASTVARSAILEDGVFVAAHACIGPRAWIGRGAIVNTAAVVEHDCDLGAFCHIAPGAVLAGGVAIGERALVGVRAAVLPRVQVGPGAILGGGAVATSDVPGGETWVGVPARNRASSAS